MNIKYLIRIVFLFTLISFPSVLVNAQKGNFSLSEFVKTSFEDYYNRTNFSDPNYTSGWFRVDDFLFWVEEEEPKLEKIFIKYYTDSDISYPPKKDLDYVILGGFLGAYYTASHCSSVENVRHVGIQEGFSSSAGTTSLVIQEDGSFISFIMGGLHEGAHMMPYLCSGIRSNSPSDNLSELVTVSAELTYGLPLNKNDIEMGRAADVRKELLREGDLNRYYTQSLLALLQYDVISSLLENNQAQKLFGYKLEKSSFSLGDFLTDLIDIRANKLTLNGQPISLKQYLKLINVLPQKRESVAGWIEDFMQDLNNSAQLPKSRHTREWDDFSDTYEKYLTKNEKLIKRLLIEHTKYFEIAPFPKGYY